MIPGLVPVPADLTHGRSWKRLVRGALREDDPATLLPCVHATETALFLRWQELARNIDFEELTAMHEATTILLAIKIHKLGWPGFQR